MFLIESCPLPHNALLATYQRNGAYTDCFKTEISCEISHSDYVCAFYTTSIFKLERIILKWAVSRPSSDAEAVLLAEGKTDTFAAWSVEKRCVNQLLMCDFQQRTRSWLMTESVESEEGIRTRLHFGSAVIPVKNIKTGKSSLGTGFRALLWFHQIYSVVLLRSAKARLAKHSS